MVLFSNPGLPEVTVAVLDGGSKQDGDAATFNFAAPINPAAPGFSAVMSLGSGFSAQFQNNAPGTNACGIQQFSTVDVNGSRLTSCAGNFDDGFGSKGALITVGGASPAASAG